MSSFGRGFPGSSTTLGGGCGTELHAHVECGLREIQHFCEVGVRQTARIVVGAVDVGHFTFAPDQCHHAVDPQFVERLPQHRVVGA